MFKIIKPRERLFSLYCESCLGSNTKHGRYTSFNGLKSYVDFFLKYHSEMKETNLNPWELVFYTPTSQVVDSGTFIKLITYTHKMIEDINLPFSLNQIVNRLGFEEPLLASFFYNGSERINLDLLTHLELCGWVLDSSFYNSLLRILDGSETYNSETGYKWNFESCYLLFSKHLKNKISLDKKTQRLVRRNLIFLIKR